MFKFRAREPQTTRPPPSPKTARHSAWIRLSPSKNGIYFSTRWVWVAVGEVNLPCFIATCYKSVISYNANCTAIGRTGIPPETYLRKKKIIICTLQAEELKICFPYCNYRCKSSKKFGSPKSPISIWTSAGQLTFSWKIFGREFWHYSRVSKFREWCVDSVGKYVTQETEIQIEI